MNKLNWLHYWLLFLLIIMAGISLYGFYDQEKQYNQILSEYIENSDSERYSDRCIMWDADKIRALKPSNVNGIAYSEGFYVVWTEERTISDIERTDYHEMCHMLIYEDEENHFCEVEE
jgi:hypothetical protein